MRPSLFLLPLYVPISSVGAHRCVCMSLCVWVSLSVFLSVCVCIHVVMCLCFVGPSIYVCVWVSLSVFQSVCVYRYVSLFCGSFYICVCVWACPSLPKLSGTPQKGRHAYHSTWHLEKSRPHTLCDCVPWDERRGKRREREIFVKVIEQ